MNQEEKKWVNQQIEDALRPKRQETFPPKENWFKRNSYWFSPAITVGSLLIAGMLGLFNTALDSRIDSRIDPKFTALRSDIDSRFQSLNNSVQQVKDSIQPIRERLVRVETKLGIGVSIKEIADSDLKTFAQSLPQLRKITEQTVSKVRPDANTLQQIAEKLRQTPQDSPEYWPTLLRFIQFASSSISASQVPAPGPPGVIVHDFKDVKFEQDNAIVLLDNGSLVDSVFRNSRIIFTEHPVGMRNVRFINCVFEMPIVSMPNPYLKKVGTQLLASQFMEIKEVS